MSQVTVKVKSKVGWNLRDRVLCLRGERRERERESEREREREKERGGVRGVTVLVTGSPQVRPSPEGSRRKNTQTDRETVTLLAQT